MSIFERRPQARWAVPVAALAVVGGVAALPTTAHADSLPTRSAEQLLVDVQQAKVDGLSGTLSEAADLGLPTLPASLGGGSSDTSLQSLVTGTHTARVWASGDTRSRISIQAGAQETTIVHDGRNVWEWQSSDQSATHYVLPAEKTAAQHPTTKTGTTPSSKDAPETPQQAAQRLVQELSKTSTVTTDDNQMVAGRPVYDLVLTPRDSASRVASVHIAIDGATHVPTRVQVFSTKTGKAAIDFGFTTVSFTRPDAKVFAFSPAKGMTVTTKDLSHPAAGQQTKPTPKTSTTKDTSSEKVVGTGWGQVVTGRVDLKAMAAQQKAAGSQSAGSQSTTSSKDSAAQMTQLLNLLPTVSGTWGTGHVLDGTLVSIVVTSDGRYAAGAVAPSALYAALPAAK